MSDKLSLFEFHTGFSLYEEGEQSVMDCPFCEHEQKFHFTREGLWDCKAGNCKKSGNAYTFIREIYNRFDNVTRTAELVHDLRGIPTEYIRANGLKYNDLNNSILIPCFKHDKLQALYKAVSTQEYDKEKGKFVTKHRILASPKESGIEHALMHWPETTHDIVWVVEGHWDKLAADAIIGHTNPITAIAVPGCGVWKPSWCEVLDSKHVVFLYDNDAAGQSGYERVIIKEIAKSRYKPKSIQYLAWPPDYPEGFDLNDLYKKEQRQSFNFIDDHVKPYTAPEHTVVVRQTIETVAADPTCNSWDELVRRFKESFYVTPDMELGLAIMIASLYSLKLDGEQLWFKIIGPPGCGKTTLAKMISACENTVLRSTFTGLFSGWKDENTEDASLAHTISNKCLIVKDSDTLVKQPNAPQIFSEFRDFYDKDSSTQYKNRIQHDYRNRRSSIILCGTNVLRRSDQSFLGERFLDYELRLTEADRTEIKKAVRRKAIQMAFNPDAVSPDAAIQAATKGFVEHHLMSRAVTIGLTEQQEDEIDRIATLVSQMRTDVERDMGGKGEVTFSPVIEVPSRLLGQLLKLALILPVITQDTRYTEAAIKKVAIDIIDPSCNRFKVCQDLREGFFSRDQLVESTGIPRTTITRVLDDLRTLDLVETRFHNVGVGRRQMQLSLKESIKENMSLLGL